MLAMPRRRLALLLALSLLAASTLALLLPVQGSRVTQANLEKIQVGMTMDEVQAILGRPSRPAYPYPSGARPRGPIHEFADDRFWKTSRDVIVVHFDLEGRVETRYLAKLGPDNRYLWERLRDSLRHDW